MIHGTIEDYAHMYAYISTKGDVNIWPTMLFVLS